MKFKTLINVDFKWVHYKTWIEYIKDFSKEELEKFEKEVVNSNPYISKVFEYLKETKKEVPEAPKAKETKKEVKEVSKKKN